jgi:hypothetical protein
MRGRRARGGCGSSRSRLDGSTLAENPILAVLPRLALTKARMNQRDELLPGGGAPVASSSRTS